MKLLVSRLVRACRLDASLYEEVEADENGTAQALTVVSLSSLAAGLGSLGSHNTLLEDGFLALIGRAFPAGP